MSESLKDQLLALGLAPKKTPPARKKQRKAKQAAAKSQNKSGEIPLDQAYRIREKEERLKKEQAVAQKREQERQRRLVNQKIKAAVKEHSVRDPAADTKRSFIYKGRIRSVLATREQIREINSGSLGVVYLSGNYHLMPIEPTEEIRTFAPDHIPDLQGADIEGEEDNPVPDDLIW
ncbi:MAG: DUF2058 domain-containing protein [Gammaproteobacteria bacterium]|nr:DUF2058 domain-containing protein [Gammaproteobacteria bacterium]MBT8072949.1 DUF2058 domain-containing protein [Gammaproteobacteria bacterium]NNK97459.1 DUF2058 family protein [Xanthomonadales bacterium]